VGLIFATCESLVNAHTMHTMQHQKDAPWCDIKPSHASWDLLPKITRTMAGHKHPVSMLVHGPPFATVPKPQQWRDGVMVKGRNEPCAVSLVLEVLVGLHLPARLATCPLPLGLAVLPDNVIAAERNKLRNEMTRQVYDNTLRFLGMNEDELACICASPSCE
jgi:hypothetical protein